MSGSEGRSSESSAKPRTRSRQAKCVGPQEKHAHFFQARSRFEPIQADGRQPFVPAAFAMTVRAEPIPSVLPSRRKRPFVGASRRALVQRGENITRT
jgi:hypothetical protein